MQHPPYQPLGWSYRYHQIYLSTFIYNENTFICKSYGDAIYILCCHLFGYFLQLLLKFETLFCFGPVQKVECPPYRDAFNKHVSHAQLSYVNICLAIGLFINIYSEAFRPAIFLCMWVCGVYGIVGFVRLKRKTKGEGWYQFGWKTMFSSIHKSDEILKKKRSLI